jgi:hypothetical protein
MGSFLTPGKNQYYWMFAKILADDHVYVRDRRLIPYTPNRATLYVDFYPALWVALPFQKVFFYINDTLVGSSSVQDPTGIVSFEAHLPKGQFILKTKNQIGGLLKQEFYNAKNYAMFFDIAGQSYEPRLTDLLQVQSDLNYETIRSGHIYPNVGVFFDFPPPPGWTNDEYRAAVLGGCGSGFRRSFFFGATKKGIKDTVESITCVPPIIQPVDSGIYWTLYDRASAPDITDPNSDAWELTDVTPALPHRRITLYERAYLATTSELVVPNSTRVVVDEQVFKQSNSYIEAPIAGPFVVAGKNLVFSIGDNVYTTVFSPTTTTAADVINDIFTQNPGVTVATYATLDGMVRIGIEPSAVQAAEVDFLTVKIISGSSLADFGFFEGDAIDVAPDQLVNPFQTTPVVITYGMQTFVQGVDFTIDTATGKIYWNPSSVAGTLVPPKGAVFLASYTYQMRREIEKMVNLVKQANLQLEFSYP